MGWGVLYYACNILDGPVALDLNISRRFVAGAFSFALLSSGLLARRIGRFLDQRGARSVLRAGAIAGPAALAALATADGRITLLLAFGALGIAQSVALYEPAFRAIVDWFPAERDCRRALLVLTSVAGLASAVFLPLTVGLVARVGWRSTVQILAVILALVTIPISWLLPAAASRACPHESRSKVSAGNPSGSLLLGMAFALQSFASTGATLYLAWHLAETGRSMAAAAAIAGLAGASQVIGRLLLAMVRPAVRTAVRLPALFVVQAGALVWVALDAGALAPLAVILFGAAAGTMTLERATVTLEWFGRDAFGTRGGQVAALSLLARGLSPAIVEGLHGTGTYRPVFLVLAGVLGAGAAIIIGAVRLRGGAISVTNSWTRPTVEESDRQPSPSTTTG